MTFTQVDLKKYGFTRLEKVVWRFEQKSELLGSIPSHSVRSFMAKVDQMLPEVGIRWDYKVLSESDYLVWLKFYEKKVLEKHFDLLATVDWYKETRAKGRTVEGLLFYQQEQLVGSLIISRDENRLASVAFEISEDIPLIHHGSLGMAVEYIYLKTMWEQGVKIISGGRSRNAFGAINSLGYLRFKSSIYKPTIPEEPTWLTTVPVIAGQPIVFFGMKDGQWCVVAHGISPEEILTQFHTGETPIWLMNDSLITNGTISP